jgi:hypothetical protein
MTRVFLIIGLALAASGGCGGGADAGAHEETGRDMWVTIDRLHRRTCPATDCGSVGVLSFREKATVYDERDGWARITRPYDASCQNGKSLYVDAGNAMCDSANGIVVGRFAEWASAEYLSPTRPADPAAGATGNHELISGSDDYRIHKDVFARAAADLIASGRCSRADFEETGGWVKSMNHRSKPVYFTYCGGMSIPNRLYLDASTGKVFR